MLPSLINMLSAWQWVVLALVPPAILALYFLKLRRQPLEVPSTYLWRKSIEDLHVNALWQRLRRNLLLWLQLAIVLLAMLALVRPGWRGAQLSGNRFVFLVDNSASMQATDVPPSRLAEAKRRVGELIDQMRSGDVAMIVSFADSARIEQTFTDNHALLRRGLDAIEPTQRSTSLAEALRVAAGLVNPGRNAENAEPRPAKLMIFSDGRFEDVSGFSLGNLDPVFVPIGAAAAANVGIVAFNTGRDPAQPDQVQAYARLENFSAQDRTVSLQLALDGRLLDADNQTVAAGQARGVTFSVPSGTAGVLHLKAQTGDHLALDDEAWTVIQPPRVSNVLLITPGDQPLETALRSGKAAETVRLELQSPAFLEKPEYAKAAAAGTYDLILYDRCVPKTMPASNTFFLGSLPPGGLWSTKQALPTPQIIDVDPSHPLMQWIDLGNVLLSEGTPLGVPPGGRVLVDSDLGPMLAIAPRDAYEDVVAGFRLVEQVAKAGAETTTYSRTDWPFRASFPVFVYNMLQYLGGGRDRLARASVKPGQPVSLRAPGTQSSLAVRTPDGQVVRLKPARPGEFTFTATSRPGAYQVLGEHGPGESFVVNLFDARESDIRPNLNGHIKIGYVSVSAQRTWEPARRETWKGILFLCMVVVIGEWWLYNQRI